MGEMALGTIPQQRQQNQGTTRKGGLAAKKGVFGGTMQMQREQ
jgi:hypothetical protein